ncbi:hypothetical protein BH160DRAFT_0107 [Burkholderia sp. H160]|nr:hypothetical protein BH160DRAFT_0107 [Burkholderia sp. H160]
MGVVRLANGDYLRIGCTCQNGRTQFLNNQQGVNFFGPRRRLPRTEIAHPYSIE